MTDHELDDFDLELAEAARREYTARNLAQHAVLGGETDPDTGDLQELMAENGTLSEELSRLEGSLEVAQQEVSELTDERNQLLYRLHQLLPDEYDMPC